MIISPKIKNWNTLKEQFGLELKKDSKNAKELSKDLTAAVNYFDFEKAKPGEHWRAKGISADKAKDATENSIVCIEYQKNNDDSGVCLFNYEGIVDGQPCFEYTGTAK